MTPRIRLHTKCAAICILSLAWWHAQPGLAQEQPPESTKLVPNQSATASNAVAASVRNRRASANGQLAQTTGLDPNPPILLPPISPSQNSSGSGFPNLTIPSGTSSVGTLQPLGILQAFDEGLARSPRAAAARAQIGIAKAQMASALTIPNPSFLLYNGFRAEQTYQVGVSLNLEPPWKLLTRIMQAKRQIKQADIEIMQSLWVLRSSVRRSYLEAVVSEATYETLQELFDLSEKLLNVAQKRFQAGDVPELDVLKARLATSQAQIDRTQGERKVLQAKQQLSILLGRSHNQVVEVNKLPTFTLRVEKNDLLPDFDKPVPPLDTFIAEAKKNRLELKLVDQQIKVNQAALKNTYANVIPNTQFNVGHSETGNPPNGPKIKNGWFMGISQELPIGNFQQGDIFRYKNMIQQLRREIISQENQIIAQVAAAYQRLITARDRIRAYQEHVLADSNEVARLARRSYEVGQSDITSTLAAQQANIQIRSQYLDAVQEYQQAFADLEQAIGRPLE